MSFNIRTITDIRKLIKTELSSLYDAREIRSLSDIIIKTLFGVDRLHLLSENEMLLTPEKIQRIRDITAALSSGRPIQYILGETSFYNCKLYVNEHTLIPRQETEELVDMIIKENPGYQGEIIDIGTGSACIAIALAKNIDGAHVTAIDISAEALVTAKLNAADNAVTVSFVEADILVPGKIPCPEAGIIVSNPPYVLESEKNRMHKNVVEHEPHNALFVPDNDPLVFYRAILESAQYLLKTKGRIYFEINEALGNEVKDLMRSYGFGNAEVIRDLNGKDRFAKGEKDGR
jgi:release factor glutamine methyltransferase